MRIQKEFCEGLKRRIYNQDRDSVTEDREDDHEQIEELREENRRLESQVEELEKQVESHDQNVAIQRGFCDSLKDRMYKDQEAAQRQTEEIFDLRQKIEKRQNDIDEKEIQILELERIIKEKDDALETILGDCKGGGPKSAKNGRSKKSKRSSLKPSRSSSKAGSKKQQNFPRSDHSSAPSMFDECATMDSRFTSL